VLWGERDVIPVNTLAAFDVPAAAPWVNVRHGAPVLASETRAVAASLPWDDADPTPLVLVSYSTVSEQRSPEKLQRTLDALADLPVHVVVTTGGIVEPDELDAPANAYLMSFADHGPLLDRAALLMGPGGHGTTMRCLAQGVPLVLSAAKALDQAGTCATVQEWGAGCALHADADAAGIRATVQDVLADPAYREEARRRATALAGLNGAALAADSYEALLAPALARAGM
jgi:UDP:flavonoid glycosyltransferase YjiC (YdhE family)